MSLNCNLFSMNSEHQAKPPENKTKQIHCTSNNNTKQYISVWQWSMSTIWHAINILRTFSLSNEIIFFEWLNDAPINTFFTWIFQLDGCFFLLLLLSMYKFHLAIMMLSPNANWMIRKKETNSKHSSSSNKCWMFEEKKKSSTWNLNQTTDKSFKNVGFFLTIGTLTECQTNMTVRPEKNSFEKLFMLAIGIVEIYLFQRFILLLFLFLSDRIVYVVYYCALCTQNTPYAWTYAHCLYAHEPYACVFFCLNFNASKDQM